MVDLVHVSVLFSFIFREAINKEKYSND